MFCHPADTRTDPVLVISHRDSHDIPAGTGGTGVLNKELHASHPVSSLKDMAIKYIHILLCGFLIGSVTFLNIIITFPSPSANTPTMQMPWKKESRAKRRMSVGLRRRGKSGKERQVPTKNEVVADRDVVREMSTLSTRYHDAGQGGENEDRVWSYLVVMPCGRS